MSESFVVYSINQNTAAIQGSTENIAFERHGGLAKPCHHRGFQGRWREAVSGPMGGATIRVQSAVLRSRRNGAVPRRKVTPDRRGAPVGVGVR